MNSQAKRMRELVHLQLLMRPPLITVHLSSLISHPLSLLSPLHQRHFPPAFVKRNLVKKCTHQDQTTARFGIERAGLPGSGNRSWIEPLALVADRKTRLIGIHRDVHTNFAV